jgi:hypothetical protein
MRESEFRKRFIVGFEHESDARRFLDEMRERWADSIRWA